jgi:hypothetical protein
MCCYRNGGKICTSVSVGRISSFAFLRSRLPGIHTLHNSELNFRTFSVVPLVSPALGVTTSLHSAGARGRRLSRAMSLFLVPPRTLAPSPTTTSNSGILVGAEGSKSFTLTPASFSNQCPRDANMRDVSLILVVDRRR